MSCQALDGLNGDLAGGLAGGLDASLVGSLIGGLNGGLVCGLVYLFRAHKKIIHEIPSSSSPRW